MLLRRSESSNSDHAQIQQCLEGEHDQYYLYSHSAFTHLLSRGAPIHISLLTQLPAFLSGLCSPETGLSAQIYIY